MPKIGRTTAKADSKFLSTRRCPSLRRLLPPTRLQDQAAELVVELSAGIPGRIDRITRGQWPKERDGQLKRIEKLVKCLRLKWHRRLARDSTGLDTYSRWGCAFPSEMNQFKAASIILVFGTKLQKSIYRVSRLSVEYVPLYANYRKLRSKYYQI